MPLPVVPPMLATTGQVTGGRSGWSWEVKKEVLDDLHPDPTMWMVNRWYPGDEDALFAACVEQHHEGVVAKRLDSPYRPGQRTRTWLKRKCPDWLDFEAPRRPPATKPFERGSRSAPEHGRSSAAPPALDAAACESSSG